MRYTVVDPRGRVSFVGPCASLEALVAACASQPRTLQQFLDAAEPFVGEMIDRILSGLAVFDEHNSPTNYASVHAAFDYFAPHETPVFRVVDPRTDELSLTPVRAGVVVFNLVAKRIVQIQNTYSEIRRRGRVRVLHSERVHRYELPPDWSLVPSR